MAEVTEGSQLTQRELSQVLKPQRTANPEALMALSTQIATEPALSELRKQLIVNPYTPEAQDTMAEKFPDSEPADRVRAVILAEPEGQYDRAFKGLPEGERKAKQLDVSADIAVRLEKYIHEPARSFWELEPAEIYRELSEMAFDTADPAKIEEMYTQSQRRGFRMAIVNFIEDLAY